MAHKVYIYMREYTGLLSLPNGTSNLANLSISFSTSPKAFIDGLSISLSLQACILSLLDIALLLLLLFFLYTLLHLSNA